MIAKPFESITKADVESLLAQQVAEGRALDYKLTLPGGKDDDKKEFLADVSSLANALGGDLIFGVSESGGIPDAIPGLSGIDADAELLRLESTIRDGIDPRLPSTQLRSIPGFANGPVFILRVARSWASPHMVTFKKTSRFYTRNSAGKYQMDVGELRSAFAASELLGERMHRFRTERLSKIIAGETPVQLPATPKMVLHLLPFAAFTLASQGGNQLPKTSKTPMQPLAAGGFSFRHNLDGFLTHNGSRRAPDEADSYCQVFRTGAVEAVRSRFVTEQDGHKWIGSVAYEREIIRGTMTYLKGLAEMEIPLPVVVTLSMTGVLGAEMFLGPQSAFVHSTPIDRDVILLPDVLIERYDVDVPATLRPIFDAVWNATGHERSFNYDSDGKWSEGR